MNDEERKYLFAELGKEIDRLREENEQLRIENQSLKDRIHDLEHGHNS